MNKNTLQLRDNKTQVTYYTAGNGPQTLLFLHGWCINSSYWQAQIEQFSHTHTVYAMDLPGFGDSQAQRENWSIAEYAQDVLAFLEALDLKEVILIGHSMSGTIIIETALTNHSRIKGLVGIDNIKFVDVVMDDKLAAEWGAMFARLKDDFKRTNEEIAEKLMFHPASPQAAIQRVKKDFGAANPAVAYPAIMEFAQFRELLPGKLDQLPLRLHLLNADFPPTNEEALDRRLSKGYALKTLADCGHYPMIEQPEEFNRLLAELLAEMA